jgi:hypothetical protein
MRYQSEAGRFGNGRQADRDGVARINATARVRDGDDRLQG